jgi:hypothetical protein
MTVAGIWQDRGAAENIVGKFFRFAFLLADKGAGLKARLDCSPFQG